MKINRLEIKKLFNKYDTFIDLTKKCTILIGPNGIGKSTSLKILECIAKHDFINLIAAPFDEIVVYYDNLKDNMGEEFRLIIKYVDLLPAPEKLKERYQLCKTYSNPIYKDPFSEELLTEESTKFMNAINALIEEGAYGQFIYFLYKKLDPTIIVNNIVCKYMHYSELTNMDLVTTNKECFRDSNFENDISGRISYEIQNTFSSLKEDNLIYFDLVQKARLTNKIISYPIICNPAIDWITSIQSSTLYGSEKNDSFDSTDKFTHFKITDCHIESINDLVLRLYKEILINSPDIIYFTDNDSKHQKKFYSTSGLDLTNIIFKKFIEDSVLDVNMLIACNYYKEDIVKSLNDIGMQLGIKFIEAIGSDNTQIRAFINPDIVTFFDDNLIRNYEQYIYPLLIQKSLFSTNIRKVLENIVRNNLDLFILDDKYHGDFIDYDRNNYDLLYLTFLYEFYNKALPMLMKEENQSLELRNFRKLLTKYIDDKHFDITPSGIHIRNRLDQNKSVFVEYDKNEIDLLQLSSGETKIILLLCLAIFMKNMIILIDEPELSLSLIWQEQLLPDLLEYGNTQTIVAATHSPYIARNNTLSEYITFLPEKKRD